MIVAVLPTHNAPPIPTPPYTTNAPVAVLIDGVILAIVNVKVVKVVNCPTLPV